MKKDSIFAEPRQHIVDFAFDESVADVFPDMIRRSVPGYDALITSIAVIAHRYFQTGSRVYDLGCSHGAATLAVYSQLKESDAHFVAVDNSEPMIRHCETQFAQHMYDAQVQCVCQDIRDVEFVDASVVIINLTLQFLPRDHRLQLIERIYKGLLPGGALVLTEKLLSENQEENRLQNDLYHHFKSANGYSDLEISQKRTALENVMKLDTAEAHFARLRNSGFSKVTRWFQCFNFASFLAIR